MNCLGRTNHASHVNICYHVSVWYVFQYKLINIGIFVNEFCSVYYLVCSCFVGDTITPIVKIIDANNLLTSDEWY